MARSALLVVVALMSAGSYRGINPESRRIAYADPPYPGQAKRWYGDHKDYAGEVDHAAIVGLP